MGFVPKGYFYLFVAQKGVILFWATKPKPKGRPMDQKSSPHQAATPKTLDEAIARAVCIGPASEIKERLYFILKDFMAQSFSVNYCKAENDAELERLKWLFERLTGRAYSYENQSDETDGEPSRGLCTCVDCGKEFYKGDEGDNEATCLRCEAAYMNSLRYSNGEDY